MISCTTVLLLALSFITQLIAASPVKRQSSLCNPVRFNTVLPTFICAESTIDFAWEGGSGKYNIFRWDQDQVGDGAFTTNAAKAKAPWLIQQRIYYLENTGLQQVQFGWGEHDTYPAGISL